MWTKARTAKLVLRLTKGKIYTNFREYNDIRLELLPPYQDKGVFKLTVENGKELIVMFRMIPGNYGGSWSLPVPKMFLLS